MTGHHVPAYHELLLITERGTARAVPQARLSRATKGGDDGARL